MPDGSDSGQKAVSSVLFFFFFVGVEFLNFIEKRLM